MAQVPKGQKHTAADAAKDGRIAAGPVQRIVQEWVAQREYAHPNDMAATGGYMAPITELAERTKISVDLILRLNRGERTWIEFDNADAIVCATVGPLAWIVDDDLNELYETFDFAHLDLNRPTCEAVVQELHDLYATRLSKRKVAALYGVNMHTVERALKKEPVAA